MYGIELVEDQLLVKLLVVKENFECCEGSWYTGHNYRKVKMLTKWP